MPHPASTGGAARRAEGRNRKIRRKHLRPLIHSHQRHSTHTIEHKRPERVIAGSTADRSRLGRHRASAAVHTECQQFIHQRPPQEDGHHIRQSERHGAGRKRRQGGCRNVIRRRRRTDRRPGIRQDRPPRHRQVGHTGTRPVLHRPDHAGRPRRPRPGRGQRPRDNARVTNPQPQKEKQSRADWRTGSGQIDNSRNASKT